MLKRIVFTALLGGALVFSAPAALADRKPGDRDHKRDRHGSSYKHHKKDRHHNGGYNRGYNRGYKRGYRDGYRDDYYYYGYNRQYSGRCYYRSGYRYYYDNGSYSSRYCDEYYSRHGYRQGSYPYGYDACDEYDYRRRYCGYSY